MTLILYAIQCYIFMQFHQTNHLEYRCTYIFMTNNFVMTSVKNVSVCQNYTVIYTLKLIKKLSNNAITIFTIKNPHLYCNRFKRNIAF